MLRLNPLRPRFVLGCTIVTLLCAGAPAALASGQIYLVLPQSTAFAILGHSCGGIKERSTPTGFSASGHPTGVVSVQTTCSTGGRGSHPHTFAGSASATWDFAGNVLSYSSPAGSPGTNTPATDAHGDTLATAGVYAVLTALAPATPFLRGAAQTGDQASVAWSPSPSPAWVGSSTVTATPQGSSARVLTAAVPGSASSALVGPLQPLTTYLITVVSTNGGGSSPVSNATTLKTPASKVPPSPPPGLSATWTAPGTGTSDPMAVSWSASTPGDSPIDSYQVLISNPDGDTTATYTQTVSGAALTATFVGLDDTFNWSIVIRAHNAAGWGAWSSRFNLGGT